MEAVQTISPADVWEVAKSLIVWLAGIGIVVDLSNTIYAGNVLKLPN